MNNLLLHPKATLAVLIAGCATVDTFCVGISSAVQPLASVHGLEHIAPQVQIACLCLGVISNLAMATAAVGRSVISTIDNAKQVQDAVKVAEANDSKPAQ